MSTTIGGSIDEDLWAAIGDPTRRQVLDLLVLDGTATSTALADRLPVTRQAIARHLQVLDDAGLVHAEVEGRERRYRVDEAQLRRAVEQLRSVSGAWDKRLGRIRAVAEELQRRRTDG